MNKTFIRKEIIKGLLDGDSIKKLQERLKLSKSAISYHLRLLKQQGIIERIGYGVWTVRKKQVQKEGYGSAMRVKNSVLKSNVIRAHAFQWTLVLPEIKGWDERRVWLDKHKKEVDFVKRHNRLVDFEVLDLGGVKVGLYDRSLVVYLNESFFCEDSKVGFEGALFRFYQIIHRVESLFSVDFRINKEYCFKLDNQHYALIKNGLAKKFAREGKKLVVYASDGLARLLIDNSLNYHEFEAVHPRMSKDDVMPVKSFFEDLVEHPITPVFVLESLARLSESQEEFMGSQASYAKNLEAHVGAIRELGEKVSGLSVLFRLGLQKFGMKRKRLLKQGFRKGQRNLFDFFG